MVSKKRVKLKSKKTNPKANVEEVKVPGKPVESIEEVEEEEFDNEFEKQYDMMLEKDIQDHLEFNSEAFDESNADEYKKSAEELIKHLTATLNNIPKNNIKENTKSEEEDSIIVFYIAL